ESHRWLLKYFHSLHTINGISTFEEYEEWRLPNSGMMCVIWQMIMFSTTESAIGCEKIFELSSLIVAYSNDIVSIERDLYQNVSTLIPLMEGENYWEKTGSAIDIVNRYYRDTVDRIVECTLKD